MQHYLGFLDATKHEEQEIFLPQTFVLTSKIKRALEQDICFVCGRKGSGKSAVATMLARLEKNGGDKYFKASQGLFEDDFAILHGTFLDDLYEISSPRLNVYSNLELCYYEIWSLILELLSLQTVLTIPDIGKEYEESINSISNYLEDIGDGESSIINIVLEKCFEAIEAAKDKVSPLSNFMFFFKKLRSNKNHLNALANMNIITEKNDIAIYVDTMESYDITDYKIYPLRGLCQAVKNFVKKQKSTSIQVKCCLPAEMTDELFQENLAKYNEFAVYLNWTYGELLEFLARRYCLYLRYKDQDIMLADKICSIAASKNITGSKNHFWYDNFWKEFAVSKVKNKFNSPENACTYMIRHTQKRPREVLSCMNFVIEHAIDEGTFPKISEKALVDGIHDDNNLWQLLTDNLSIFNFPQIDKNISDIASTILVDEKVIFSGKHFNRFAKRAISELCFTDEIDKLSFAKNLLIRSGLIGRVIPYSHSETGHSWVDHDSKEQCKYYVTEFEYLIPGKVVITDESLCAVHPMLADRLKLMNEESDIGVVYPIPEKDDLTEGLLEKYGNKQC